MAVQKTRQVTVRSSRRLLRILIASGVVIAGFLLSAGAALASTICDNFGGTICCGTQDWGAFNSTRYASWTGDAGKYYYARRRDLSFTLTFNQYMTNGGYLFKDFGTDNERGTGMYREETPLMTYAVTDATDNSC